MLQPIKSDMENVIDFVNLSPITVPLPTGYIRRKFMHLKTERKEKSEMN